MKTDDRTDKLTDMDRYLLTQMEDGRAYGHRYLPWTSLHCFGPRHLTGSRLHKLARMGYLAGLHPWYAYPGDDPHYSGFVKVKDPDDRITEAEMAELRSHHENIKVLHYWRTDNALMVVLRRAASPLLYFYSVRDDGTTVKAVLDRISC